jgi:hypothetical protein
MYRSMYLFKMISGFSADLFLAGFSRKEGGYIL